MTWEPPDFSKPTVARVYDALAGGYDNFAPDRALAAELIRIYPGVPDLVRENRAFIIRAVTWAAGQGIRQFADIGTGPPQWPSVAEAARAVIPSVKVIYVDNDSVVVSHVRARLVTGDDTGAIDADLADPAIVTGHPAFRGVIDIAKPVCLIFGLVLGLMPPGQARQVITGYAGLVAPGSLFVISCIRVDDDGLRDQLARAFTAAKTYNHARCEITGFLGGLELIDPGLVVARAWRGGMPDPHLSPGTPAYVLGAAARRK